ncbi:MAG: response regulator [Pirellulales bacterium]
MAQKKSVLIVDDDPDVCISVAHRLQGMSYATRTACNGRQALTEVDVRRPDIIILDIRMPGIDGLTVLSELQKNEMTKDIPVIMLSASFVDKRRAFAAGARFFINKPYRGSDLVAAVDAAGKPSVCTPVASRR